ncbi:regulator of G-protein signaling 21-like [Cheilinus undulatus]|uniref:regulator of G-protein signaling 21-like n=1 Tax=Cheilinus undulatus TaxID=241271 RepID=UPI001BD6CF53|nr:regulator of G-protein signaling 21-like [Cheilinus undulatus]
MPDSGKGLTLRVSRRGLANQDGKREKGGQLRYMTAFITVVMQLSLKAFDWCNVNSMPGHNPEVEGRETQAAKDQRVLFVFIYSSALRYETSFSLFGTGKHMLAPIDDVVAWGESLEQLLECKTGQLVFEDFLRTEYSEENLLFWLACEEYKKITSEAEMTLAAKRIHTDFVQVDAPRQINIDCVTREEISENLSQPGPNCFDRAQRLIYALMENDCYPRFLKSEIYQALLEQQ